MATGVFLGLATLGGALACSDNSDKKAGDEDVESLSEVGQETLRDWADAAVTGYELFAEDARGLAQQSAKYCSEPTEVGLDDARRAYHRARRSWLLLRTFAFGPEVEWPARLGPKIDFRPPRYEDIEEHLAAEGVLAPPAERGAQLRGFAAIEYVLFHAAPEEAPSLSRACESLRLVTDDLAESATKLARIWSPGGDNYVGELLVEEGTSTFDSMSDALSGIVNRMGYVVENLRDQDLRAPLGEEQGVVQEQLVVSLLSDRTADDFRDTLAGLEKLLFGTPETLGLTHYARDRGVDLDEELHGAFEEAEAKIDALPVPFVDALAGSSEKVRELDEALLALQLLIQIELIGSLELSQIFNDADGD